MLMYPSFRSAFLLVLFALSTGVRAETGVSLLQYELKRLDTPAVEALSQYAGKPVLMIFFEPDCTWCFRQVKTINELLAHCTDDFQPLAIGVNASRTGLQRELHRLKPAFPAFQGSPELLSNLGGVPATPFTLIGNASGLYVNWLRGYQDKQQLKQFLRDNDAPICSASS